MVYLLYYVFPPHYRYDDSAFHYHSSVTLLISEEKRVIDVPFLMWQKEKMVMHTTS